MAHPQLKLELLWCVSAPFLMTKQIYAALSAMTAIALLCLAPNAFATRVQRPRALVRTALPRAKDRTIHKLRPVEQSRNQRRPVRNARPERHSVAVARPVARGRRGRVAVPVVAVRQHRDRRGRLIAVRQSVVAPAPKRIIQPPLLVAARVAPESRESGVSHPPDFNDVDLTPTSADTTAPADAPLPVISVIRPTTDKPQLPSIEDAATTNEILPSLYNKRGRLVMPAALKGSHEILIHQNQVADHDGLERVQDDSDLESMRRRSMLVAIPLSAGMQVDTRLPGNRRYCRPWTAQFLATIARAHYAQFHTSLQVNSAVRTVDFQQRLIRTNGNAAPAGGETASPHLTGQAVDLAKRGLSLSEIAWMRGYLLPLIQSGKIDVEEEFQQSCFHISVYKSYVPGVQIPRRNIASTHRDSPAALALAIH